MGNREDPDVYFTAANFLLNTTNTRSTGLFHLPLHVGVSGEGRPRSRCGRDIGGHLSGNTSERLRTSSLLLADHVALWLHQSVTSSCH